MKYTCLIADDMLLERDTIQFFLEKTGKVDVVASCANGMEAYEILQKQAVDIVFTDIDMPHITGLGLLNSLAQKPVFVFITSHANYAVTGFELDAVDFVVKPVTFHRLLHAVNKATDAVACIKALAREDAATNPEKEDYILIRTSDKLVRLNHNEIVYMESAGNFTKIFTVHGDVHLTLVNLKNVVLQLPTNDMQRTNRQFVVNTRHIKSIELNSITLAGNHAVPVTAQYKQAIIDSMNLVLIQRDHRG